MQTAWECLSCGAHAQTKPYCEACGAAQPVDGGEDSALSLMMGLVCTSCDAYNDPGVSVCASCGTQLEVVDLDEVAATTNAVATSEAAAALPPSWLTPPTGQPLSTQFAMKAVDLATVATGAEGAGVAAPAPPRAATPQPSPTPVAPPQMTAQQTQQVPTPMPSPAAAQAQAPSSRTPMAGTPVVAVVTKVPSCAKCGTALADDDRFCRNCGTRVGAAGGATPSMPSPAAATSSPMVTTQIAAARISNLPSPILPHNATMVMPAMHAAQSGTQAAQLPSSSGQAQPSTTMFFGAVTAERTAKLILVRGQSAFGTQWRLQAGETMIGRAEGMVLFPDDNALAARHCKLVFRGADLWLEPEETVNGVFVRVRDPVQLTRGDEVVVGAQRLRVLGEDDRPIAVPNADASTRILGSLVKPAPPISLMRIASDPTQNEVFYRCQRLLTIGRNNCDLNFPRDSFVSERHAQITHDGNGLVLEDLRSRNGTYLRARSATKLLHGDLVLLGDKVLRVELPR